jgi:tRNA threonylcarbamoyladenosine modification (KEOPS) complex Cgi121 subunit
MENSGFLSTRDALERITIVGITGVDIESVDELLSGLSALGTFQLMDAGLILDEDHVRFACFEALRSFESGENVTASPSMEILVKSACTTQIKDAIGMLGIRGGSREAVLVAVDADEEEVAHAVQLTGGERSSRPLKSTPEKRKRVAEAFSLAEPVERSLLEKIALSGSG